MDRGKYTHKYRKHFKCVKMCRHIRFPAKNILVYWEEIQYGENTVHV